MKTVCDNPKAVFPSVILTLALACCLTTLVSPPLALALGILIALTTGNPHLQQSKRLSALLLKVCVVLLGFTMNLSIVLKAGLDTALFAAVGIALTFVLGTVSARWLCVPKRLSLLISAGTAICGGSAIAAMGSVIGADDEEMTISLGTIFLLNAVALYLFPLVGRSLHLTQAQFGTWAGIAIHDISSVVGAATSYGSSALQTAIAVKLSRSLWIIPVSTMAAHFVAKTDEGTDSKKRIDIPWFIGLFLLAAVVRSYVPSVAAFAPYIAAIATVGLAVTLLLIGTTLSKVTCHRVGWRPVAQGLFLWIVISTVTLAAVLRFV